MSEELAQLRGRLQALKNQCREIGQIPPRPPGLRAAVGAIGVAIMHRLMFWYAPALQRVIGGLIQTVDDALGTQPGGMEGILEQERLTTIGLESAVQEQADALQQLGEEQRLKEEDLAKRWEAAEERHQLLRREVLENGQRLVRLLDETRRLSQGGTPAPPSTGCRADALGEEDLDQLYSGLENEVP